MCGNARSGSTSCDRQSQVGLASLPDVDTRDWRVAGSHSRFYDWAHENPVHVAEACGRGLRQRPAAEACGRGMRKWLNVASYQCQGHVRDASRTVPKGMGEREGRDPLAERGRLVDIAEGMCEMPRRQCQRAS